MNPTLLAVMLFLASIYAAAAQFNGCPPGLCSGSNGMGNSGGGFNGGGAPATPLVSCASTGIFNLSNVCNDIYFIGALK